MCSRLVVLNSARARVVGSQVNLREKEAGWDTEAISKQDRVSANHGSESVPAVPCSGPRITTSGTPLPQGIVGPDTGPGRTWGPDGASA